MDCLYGPRVIDVIVRKPEFKFLIRYYDLLYQSLIPNCKLTISTLKQHLEVPSEVESYIINGESLRIRCQRIINLLLVHLDTTKDYKHFLCLFSKITVMTDLPDKLRTESQHTPHWDVGTQNYHNSQTTGSALYSTVYKSHPSRLTTTYSVYQLETCAVDNIIIQCVDDGASDGRSDNCHIGHWAIGRRRCRVVTTINQYHPVNMLRTSRIRPIVDWSCLMSLPELTQLDEHFSQFCNCSCDDYQFTLEKLKGLPQLSIEDHQQLGAVISSSCDVQLVNEKIFTFLIVKLCYNGSSGGLAGLCDVMDNLIGSGKSTGGVPQASKRILTNTTTSGVVTSDHLQSNSNPVSIDVSFSVTDHETISYPIVLSSTGSESGENIQALALVRSKYDVIVQLLPSDYERTLEIVQDHLTDDQICDVLICPNYTNANGVILNCLMGKINCVADIGKFCDTLKNIAALLPDPGALLAVVHEFKREKPASSQQAVVDERNPPQRIILNKDFAQLKMHYHAILQLMPDDYEQSIEKLQNYISDDQICMILSSSNSSIANKKILDCLIDKMSCTEELLHLCNQLESISASHQLIMIISEIRLAVQQSIQFLTSKTCTTNTQSLSSYQEHHSTSPIGVNNSLYEDTFSRIRLDPSSKVLPILKRNYTKLCHCLPQDYIKTVDKLRQCFDMPANFLNQMTELPSTALINENIVASLIYTITADIGVVRLCAIFDELSDGLNSKQFIESLRNEFLEALCLLPPTATTTTASLHNDGTSLSPGAHNPTTLHHTSHDSSVSVDSSPVASKTQSPQPKGYLSSKIELEEQLNYKHKRLEKGINCPPPPPLPPNYVCRQQLLNEMVTYLSQSTTDQSSFGTTLTVIGAGGFGKTSIVTALCHNPVMKEHFTDGVVFIELGPQVIDPSMKLTHIYHLLTGQYLKQGDINHVEQEVNQLVSLYCRNLLVIIDDVWQFGDAEPIVKAFFNCKIVLTSRMNDIEHFIPTKHVVNVGPMEQSEGISLLTRGVIDISQLSQEDKRLLDDLAQDIHLWPLLLSLTRGQLSHNLKHYKFSCRKAIEMLQNKFREKGLKAFDKNNIERSRRYATKACIDLTLDLLTKSQADKMKTLILWTGIGTSIQTAVLHTLWNTTENEARDIVEALWAKSLVQFTDTTILAHNDTQHCVEVHAVISQYIIESIDSEEVETLSPDGKINTASSTTNEIKLYYQKSFIGYDASSSYAVNHLQMLLNALENCFFPLNLKRINMFVIYDPHTTIVSLQRIQDALEISPNITTFVPSVNEEIKSVINDCHKILKDAHKTNRILNQNIQQCLAKRNYYNVIQTIEVYMSKYPPGLIAQQVITVLKKIIPYCDDKQLLHGLNMQCEQFNMKTPDYHIITLMVLPRIKLYTKYFYQIGKALRAGTHDDIQRAYHYFTSHQRSQEDELVSTNCLIKLQEVAPNWVHQRFH